MNPDTDRRAPERDEDREDERKNKRNRESHCNYLDQCSEPSDGTNLRERDTMSGIDKETAVNAQIAVH